MENIHQPAGNFHPENFPDELKSGSHWLVWRYEHRGGKPTKVPRDARTGAAGSSTNPDTWCTYEEGLKAYQTGRYSGIGRVIVDGLVGIDVDGCLNPETGELSPQAEDFIRLFDSYSEISPSLTGVKIWVRGELPRSYKRGGLEVYNGGRFFTVTGMSFSWTSPYVETRQDELDAFVAAEFPRKRGSGLKPASWGLGRKLDLGEFLGRVGVEILREIHDDSAEVAYGIRCPWVDEHTDGDESGTRVGQYPDGATWFRCEHSHCGDRAWAEFREHVDPRVKGFKRNVTVYQASRKVTV